MPFYFMLKVLLLRKYLNFCLDFLVVQKKPHDQKHKVNYENL